MVLEHDYKRDAVMVSAYEYEDMKRLAKEASRLRAEHRTMREALEEIEKNLGRYGPIAVGALSRETIVADLVEAHDTAQRALDPSSAPAPKDTDGLTEKP